MRNDERFEIQRAFDLLPHVVGASWATVGLEWKGLENQQEKNLEKKH